MDRRAFLASAAALFAAPLAAEAQQAGKVYRLGYLGITRPPVRSASSFEVIAAGLRELGSLRSVFARACARAKLPGVTPHVLRHTFASRLAMAGVPLRAIQELGGWRSLRMVERYAHLSPEYQADAVERLANFPTLFTTHGGGRLKGVAQVGYSTGGSR